MLTSLLISCTVLSALNLVLLYNTHLLARRHDEVKRQDNNNEKPTVSFTFNDFIKKHYYSSWSSKSAALCLSIVSYTEVVFEMLLRHKKPVWRWRWITCIETLKCVSFIIYNLHCLYLINDLIFLEPWCVLSYFEHRKVEWSCIQLISFETLIHHRSSSTQPTSSSYQQLILELEYHRQAIPIC